MKPFFLFLLTLFTLPLFAADLVVEEFGVAPAYSGIQIAIDAAAPGDRILIKNRPGGIPWFENLTINKSIELLSYDNDFWFIIQGDITIIPNNITVTIVGMINRGGDINRSSPTGNPRSSVFNIIDCHITGSINLDNFRIVANIVGNTIVDGTVELIHGKIIGNDLRNCIMEVTSSTITYDTEDFLIVGNKIWKSSTPMNIECSHYNFHIKNNFVYCTGNGGNAHDGINILEANNSNLIHYIYNNTVKIAATSFSSYSAIKLRSSSTSPWLAIVEIMNNVLDGSSGSNNNAHGILIPTAHIQGDINLYYNFIDGHFRHALNSNPTVNFNNNGTSTFTIPVSAVLPSNHPGIDGANPGPAFYDLDLSRGDAGCYGGSYTLDNFFPLHTGAARVYMVTYPFNVRQGSTLSINADAYDR